jgi:spermidine synthase
MPGDKVVSHHEGVMASVSVVKDEEDGVHLKVNNHFQMGGTSSVFSDWRQGLLPLLLHPRPEKALFLGLGTGATLAAAGNYPGLLTDGVELIPEVTKVMSYFEKSTGDLSQLENLNIVSADARRYVYSTDKQYDVIVADLFHPSRDGAASLYTVEHFQAVRNQLTEEGLFCQWLPLYQLDMDMFKVIARSFLEVFPDGQAYLGHYSLDYPIIALIGGNNPLRFPENWYDKRIRRARMHKAASAFGYDSIYSLLGTLLAGSQELAEFVEGSPLNTDNHPVVLFQAPRFVYGSPEPAHERLLALIETFPSPDPEGILAEIITEEDMLARERLPDYWRARNSFLQVGINIEKTGNVVQLYEKVSEPLLKVVKKSVDFSAAYYPLLSIAYDIYPYDRKASYQLLTDLSRANPRRPEAAILRKRLFLKRPS